MADSLPRDARVSSAATAALVAAINERPGIQFEELTEPCNHHPVVALLFTGPVCMQHFDGLIEATSKVAGVRICAMQELKPRRWPRSVPARADAVPANGGVRDGTSRAA